MSKDREKFWEVQHKTEDGFWYGHTENSTEQSALATAKVLARSNREVRVVRYDASTVIGVKP